MSRRLSCTSSFTLQTNYSTTTTWTYATLSVGARSSNSDYMYNMGNRVVATSLSARHYKTVCQQERGYDLMLQKDTISPAQSRKKGNKGI